MSRIDIAERMECEYIDLDATRLESGSLIDRAEKSDFHYFFMLDSDLNSEIEAFLQWTVQRNRRIMVFIISDSPVFGLDITKTLPVCGLPSTDLALALELVSRMAQPGGTSVDAEDLATLMSNPGVCRMLIDSFAPLDFASYCAYFHVPMPGENQFDGQKLKRVGMSVRTLCHPDALVVGSWAVDEQDAPVLVLLFPWPASATRQRVDPTINSVMC